MLRRAASWMGVGVVVALAVGTGLAQCSSGQGAGSRPADAAVEGRADAGAEGHTIQEAGDDVGAETEAEAEAAATDAAAPPFCLPQYAQETSNVLAGWPGWRRMPGLDPCCAIATPIDLTASMPAWSWVPCSNGLAGCLDFYAPWAPPQGTIVFAFPFPPASHDASGNPKWLMFRRAVDPQPYSTPGANFGPIEYDLYDIPTGTPLGAWRKDDFVDRSAANECGIDVLIGQSTVTVAAELVSLDRLLGLSVAHGIPSAMLGSPSFTTYTRLLPGLQDVGASDSLFAFDTPGALVRADFGATALAVGSTNVSLWLALVEGADVFGATTNLPQQMFAFHQGGSPELLRANPNADVGSPASDGTRLYWTETYGPSGGPRQIELWSAPYTSDPAQLAATASRFATVSSTLDPAGARAVAFGGVMAVPNASQAQPTMTTAIVGRVSDGKIIQVNPGPGRYIGQVVALTPSELWAITVDSNSAGFHGYLSRISLGDW